MNTCRGLLMIFPLILSFACGGGPSDSAQSDAQSGSAPSDLSDQDNDFIADREENADSKIDTDNDGNPDYLDTDSDNDGISDADEVTDRNLETPAQDADQNGIPNFRDPDSDADCIPDYLEAGDADPRTLPVDTDNDSAPDFIDVDSDSDGLADGKEDKNCDSVMDSGESSSLIGDTDGDGTGDLIENAAMTDPQNKADNPAAHGDFVFEMPYEKPPIPQSDDLQFSTSLKKVDVYVLMDSSGSMNEELQSVKTKLTGVLEGLACAPGQTDNCIKSLWTGMGKFEYAERNPYRNLISMQPFLSAIGKLDLKAETNGCVDCRETHLLALWGTLTGKASTESGCGAVPFDAGPSCDGSVAGEEAFGYPCFRKDALPVVIMATDEPMHHGDFCPSMEVVEAQLSQTHAKFIGVLGSNPSQLLRNEMAALAWHSGATGKYGAPFLFEGSNAEAANGIGNAIKSLADNLLMEVDSSLLDNDGDDVDTVSSFVQSLVAFPSGTAQCSDSQIADFDKDGVFEGFDAVKPGTPLCWRIELKQNQSVVPVADPQLFKATINIRGEKSSLLDTREIYFLVPPSLPTLSIE